MKKFSIIDYGVSNLLSLKRALVDLGADCSFADTKDKIRKSDILILPGDGAFKAGMRGIIKRKLTRAIKNHFRRGKPILGVCLGMQLLFTKGYEFGACVGLDLIKGKIRSFPEFKDKNIKIPHIGWNNLIPISNKKPTLLPNNSLKLNVYFVHSYICFPEKKEVILAQTEYGGYKFPSIIGEGNVFGCQFHPEKSGKDGMVILKNFIDRYK